VAGSPCSTIIDPGGNHSIRTSSLANRIVVDSSANNVRARP
jgi:hypothetical protein